MSLSSGLDIHREMGHGLRAVNQSVHAPTAWAMATICCAGVIVPRAFDT